MRQPVYQRLNYERDYSEKNGEQTDAEGNTGCAPVISRINQELLQEREELGICYRNAAFRDYRGGFSMANFRRCRCPK